jgi:hypothetical protein
MRHQKFSLTNVFMTTLFVSGAIGVAAIAFNYSGKVDIRLGSDGIVFRIDGDKAHKLEQAKP